MILCHPEIETIMDFTAYSVWSLVIESPLFFRSFLTDLYEQYNGAEGQIVLSENDKQLNISSYVEIISNPLCYPLTNKAIINKITARMEQIANSEDFYLKTAEIMQRLEAHINELAFSLDCDVICNPCNIGSMLKAVGISVRDEYDDPLERLIDYMELVREFDKEKLFVFVNLRSCFSESEISWFFATAQNHGYRILLLDAKAEQKNGYEHRITIDKDLCEF